MRVDSRDIGQLRADVAANVRVFIGLMAERGYPVGIAGTYRNDEQQAYLHELGRTLPGRIVTGSRVTTFHGARLAFDIFQNVRGREYGDTAFWDAARQLLTAMGFSFLTIEKAHAQWSAGGRYSGMQVRAGVLPPPMPLYQPAADKMPTSVLHTGSHSQDVAVLQRRLNRNGARLEVDGDFGPVTLSAFKSYQTAHRLTVDGIAGPQTWASLFKEEA